MRRALDELNPGKPAVADQISMQGRFLIGLLRDGELLDARCGSNLIVNNGRALFIDTIQGTLGYPYAFDSEAIGLDSTTPAASDTTLGSQQAIRGGVLSQPTAYTDRLVTTFDWAAGAGGIREAGRFGYDAGENYVLVARITFAQIYKSVGDTLIVTHDLIL